MAIGSFGIGLSGLNGAMRSLDRAAFEVARASNHNSGPPAIGGADPVRPPAAVAAAVPAASSSGLEADVDLPRAMVDMISASRLFMANLQTIRRSDEALDALLKDR